MPAKNEVTFFAVVMRPHGKLHVWSVIHSQSRAEARPLPSSTLVTCAVNHSSPGKHCRHVM